jgi:hypothetical protein
MSGRDTSIGCLVNFPIVRILRKRLYNDTSDYKAAQTTKTTTLGLMLFRRNHYEWSVRFVHKSQMRARRTRLRGAQTTAA